MRHTSIRQRVVLPKYVLDLFWEYPKKSLSWQKDSDLIIRRILEAGELETLKWLLATAGYSLLRNWILEHRGAGLEPKRLRFWQQALKLPPHEVDSWIMSNHSNPWQNR